MNERGKNVTHPSRNKRREQRLAAFPRVRLVLGRETKVEATGRSVVRLTDFIRFLGDQNEKNTEIEEMHRFHKRIEDRTTKEIISSEPDAERNEN